MSESDDAAIEEIPSDIDDDSSDEANACGKCGGGQGAARLWIGSELSSVVPQAMCVSFPLII